LLEAVKYLKQSGLSVIAASEKATMSYTQANYADPVAIVMGAEDVGISKEILRVCDQMVSIPIKGIIQSLNVSVAAGVLIYEAVKQR
jgi:23S rRNA (guanosine2251-2'-O)-methyltransferase